MNATITTNLENYTGEVATIEMTDGKFEMYGYHFTIGEFVDVYKGEGYAPLTGDEWDEATGPLATLMVEDGKPETLLKAAVIYVANHV